MRTADLFFFQRKTSDSSDAVLEANLYKAGQVLN